MTVSPFPWTSLEAVTRRSVRKTAIARRALGRPRIAHMEHVLAELTGASVRIIVRHVDDGLRRGRELGARTALALADDATFVELDAEPSLVARVIGHLLGRPTPLERPDALLDESLRGGFAALVLETARRISGSPVRLVGRPARSDDALHVAATVLFDDQAYELFATIVADWQPPRPAELAALGALPIALPIVAASAAASRQLLSELRPGAAWLPGDGWTINGDGTGGALLAPPLVETGIPVELVQDGSIVLRGHPVHSSWDAEFAMTEPKQDQSVADVVLDAPVVVRVEIGSVTLTARQWADLGPGDVIETGRRIAEPVSLRVAGQEVARGELVSIEGELGVRIRELVGTAESSR